MLKRIHFLVMAAALLGWAGGCESARTSTAATGSPREAAETGSNGPPNWELRLIRSVADVSQSQKVDPAVTCAEGSCPTLEEALAPQQCQGPPSAVAAPTWQGHQYVVTGCGLTSVHRAGFIYTAYWYDGFGAPPVAVFRGNDAGAALWSQTRSIECPASEQRTCATCGDGYPSCAEPGWLPEPPPPRLPDPAPPTSAPPGIQIEPRPDTPPESPSVEANGCRFEYLGDWISCEDGGWPFAELQPGASFEQCLSACLERTECTAVIDYHWLGRPDLGCSLFLSSCDAPETGPWQQEDGGRYYRKVCSGG